MIREAARQAFLNAQEQQSRTRLGEVLAPLDVSALEVVHYEAAPDWALHVFTDGDVHLAVRQPEGSVNAVRDENGWTSVAGPVESLEQLGEVLPEPSGVTYEPWVAPFDKATAYQLGARVSHGGDNYESVVKDNMVEPGTGSGWQVLP